MGRASILVCLLPPPFIGKTLLDPFCAKFVSLLCTPAFCLDLRLGKKPPPFPTAPPKLFEIVLLEVAPY